MGLVDYSDSEGSESDASPATKPALKPAPKPAASSGKPAFQKVVDRSNPHKIRVNLPSAAAAGASDTPTASDEPPAKKARTGGGAFSGFNSFLPAPKRSGEAAGGAAKRAPGSGLGKGVSLKTGAAPGFSREPVEEASGHGQDKQDGREDEDAYGPEAPAEEPKPAEEVKLVGKPMMFKPLSVANNAKKKKAAATPPAVPKPSIPQSPATEAVPVEKGEPAPAQIPPKPKPKVSLFSISREDSSPVPSASGGVYEPMMYTSQQSTTPLYADGNDTAAPYQISTTDASQPSGPQSLNTVASDLNLTEAQKRQLFGRQRGKGAPDLSAINVVNFNTDQEYAHNEELRASGEIIQHNQVKTIAPGKHSLQQLVNNAAMQKDALEEHFATGKRNKREAGSKYGW
ncbi:mitotic checkpoint regulator, MAD2B-interacting-domain-containing protein [Macrophomina phaseolina]|uniref:Mitotic checkpoint regulator, MAD2B-interacting-domain-containing protein n=1 Tax=Macrophomina phaseolina TaxID=35725 RepID=A0ABQ8FT02_9PEZI|nr:mitotic checkpoint regulator, MAD2B-interacting-domain-containing protein [Macrophomina phaseolina]